MTALTRSRKKARKGVRLTRAPKYRITPVEGRARTFTGRLLKTVNVGPLRLAIFKVPKQRRKSD